MFVIRYTVNGEVPKGSPKPKPQTLERVRRRLALIEDDWSQTLGVQGPNMAVSVEMGNDSIRVVNTEGNTLQWDIVEVSS